jgi:hypothetical protein
LYIINGLRIGIDNFMACGGRAPNLYCAVSTSGRTTPAYSDDCHDIR